MREEIGVLCEEGGFRPLGASTPSLSPSSSGNVRTPNDPMPPKPMQSKRGREDLEYPGEELPDDHNSDKEGKYLSDEEEVDLEVPAPALRFFKAEDYQNHFRFRFAV